MKIVRKNNKYYYVKQNNKYYGIGSGESNILYQPKLDGTEQITIMSGQNSPTITNNTLTGYTSSGNGGSGYLSEGWDNTVLWQLTFKGRVNTPGFAGILLVCNTTQRDNNEINISNENLWVYKGTSATTYSYSPDIVSSIMLDVVITKINSTTVSIKVGNGNPVTINNFTPLSQTNKCYIGVDSWDRGSNNYAVISDIKVTKMGT